MKMILMKPFKDIFIIILIMTKSIMMNFDDSDMNEYALYKHTWCDCGECHETGYHGITEDVQIFRVVNEDDRKQFRKFIHGGKKDKQWFHKMPKLASAEEVMRIFADFQPAANGKYYCGAKSRIDGINAPLDITRSLIASLT